MVVQRTWVFSSIFVVLFIAYRSVNFPCSISIAVLLLSFVLLYYSCSIIFKQYNCSDLHSSSTQVIVHFYWPVGYVVSLLILGRGWDSGDLGFGSVAESMDFMGLPFWWLGGLWWRGAQGLGFTGEEHCLSYVWSMANVMRVLWAQ